MPAGENSATGGASLSGQLRRGALGFGLIGAALGLSTALGPAALLLVAPGLVALRGCPMCWAAGLIEALRAERPARSCAGENCGLGRGSRAAAMSAAEEG